MKVTVSLEEQTGVEGNNHDFISQPKSIRVNQPELSNSGMSNYEVFFRKGKFCLDCCLCCLLQQMTVSVPLNFISGPD